MKNTLQQARDVLNQFVNVCTNLNCESTSPDWEHVGSKSEIIQTKRNQKLREIKNFEVFKCQKCNHTLDVEVIS